MDKYKADLQKMLRNARMTCGFSQNQVADILHMDRSTYTYYESGKTTPDISTLRRLALLFRVPADAFLFPEDYDAQAPDKLRMYSRKKACPSPQKIGELTREEKRMIAAYRVGNIKITPVDDSGDKRENKK